MVTITKDGKELLSTAEIMELFQISRGTVLNWDKQGKLIPYKVGRKKLYKTEDIKKLFIEMY